MSWNKMITQRLFTALRTGGTSFRRAAALSLRRSPNKNTPEPRYDGIFRRYLHRNMADPPSQSVVPFLPVGQKLRGMDTLREMISLDVMMSPAETPVRMMTAADARKILSMPQLAAVKLKLKKNEKDCVSYSDFVEICVKESSSKDQGLEFAKILDESGSVLVLGNIVFLRPEKVIKAIQGLLVPLISQNTTNPRIKALQKMEHQKVYIEKKAESYVHRELWCGLGFLVVQTSLFVRLTFWELSWDVMEPICFFVTSMYFMGGYAFFLRTSQEPSFEGFYKSRLSAKRNRLMKAAEFDVDRYNELTKACYTNLLTNRLV